MSISSLEKSINHEFNELMKDHWTFLDEKWPKVILPKYYRSEIKHMCYIPEVKKVLLDRLGHIPVFCFQTYV